MWRFFIYVHSEGPKKIQKPKPWKHSEPITREQLMQMRDEFWDTAPHYGGRKGMLSLTKLLLITSFTEDILWYCYTVHAAILCKFESLASNFCKTICTCNSS